jgi:hypothetical protein
MAANGRGATLMTTGPELFTGELFIQGCLGTDQIALSSIVGEAPKSLLQVPVLVTFEPDGLARLRIEDLAGLPRQGPDNPIFFDFSRSSSKLVVRYPDADNRDEGADQVWLLEAGSRQPFPATWLGTDWRFVITGDFLVSFVAPSSPRSPFSIDVTER